uniref:Zinc finger protein n=1 Tax=Loa loa TaxID=7209 RepID=A0A1I7VHY7_LOALO
MLTNPGNPDIANPLDFLKRESVMLQTFQGFVSETVEFETSLITCLEEAEKRLVEYAGRNTRDEMDEGLAHQEPEFNEETEWAALPEEDDETENWPSGSEWTPLSDDEEDEPEVTVIRMETSGVEEPEETIREIETKDDQIPGSSHTYNVGCGDPGSISPEDLGDLPEQFQGELEVAQAEPYMVVQREGNINIGFCCRCGHYLLLPPGFTAAQKTAAVEHYALDWCPRAYAAVINERQANNAIWHSTSGQPATACSSSPSPIQRRHQTG